jgi:hypothetical protein
MVYSTDSGLTWTIGTLPTGAGNLNSIDYSPTLNLWIICNMLVADGTPLLWSASTITSGTTTAWSINLVRSGAATIDAQHVMWISQQSQFILLTGRGPALQWFSSNGVNWTVATTSQNVGNNFQAKLRYSSTYNHLYESHQGNLTAINSFNSGVTWSVMSPNPGMYRPIDIMRVTTNMWIGLNATVNEGLMVSYDNWTTKTSYQAQIYSILPGAPTTVSLYCIAMTGAIP